MNKTNPGPRRKKPWGMQISDTKPTRNKRKCRQWPLMAVCTRPMLYCVRKLQLYMQYKYMGFGLESSWFSANFLFFVAHQVCLANF